MTAPRSLTVLLVLVLAGTACSSSSNPSQSATAETPAATAEPAAEPTEAPTPAGPTPADPTPTAASETPADDGEEPPVTPAPEPTATPDPSTLRVEIPDDLDLQLTAVFDVSQPIDLAVRPGRDTIYLATKAGRVLELEIDGDEAGVVTDVLDLRGQVGGGNEQGLLGLAFSPDGDTMYVNYTDAGGDTVVGGARFASPGGDELTDPASVVPVLTVDQPRSNHNGGAIAFGPDGHLYVALGDGGGAGDPFGVGQDPFSLLGTIVRIDPKIDDDGGSYSIPADNPFADGEQGAPEVFIWGARNPWRIGFDRLTGDLWIADVGQNALEEVDVLYASQGGGAGANLGWPDVEGTAAFAAVGPPEENYVGPLYDYGRGDGCSVTGGYVYRGQAIPQLQGHYVFGDFCTSVLWGLASSQQQGLLGRFDLGLRVPGSTLASFGEGPDGELYVLSFDGTLYRIDPA